MFCNRCGKEINEGIKFCPACGKEIKPVVKSGNAIKPEASVELKANHEPQVYEQEKPFVNVSGAGIGIGKILLIVISALLVTAGVVFVLILKPWKDEPKEANQPSEVQEETLNENVSETMGEDKEEETHVEHIEELSSVLPEEALMEYAKSLDYISGLVGYYNKDIIEKFRDTYWEEEAVLDFSGAPFGNIDCFIEDFDKDGQDELLIISAEGPDNVGITLSMYEYDNEVKLADMYDMEGYYYPGYDSSEWLYLSYDFAGKKYIAIVCHGDVYLMADGTNIGFISCYYDGKSFVKMGETGYACSDWSEEDTRVTDELHRCGVMISWDDCFEKNFCSEVLSCTNGERLVSVEQRINNYTHDDSTGKYSDLSGYIKYKGYSTNEFTKHENTAITEDYIIPDSSDRLLTEEDISQLTDDMLRKARNEIVARHGRRFKDEELQAYFDSKPWYKGTIEPDDFNLVVELSEIEQRNMEFIQSHEK